MCRGVPLDNNRIIASALLETARAYEFLDENPYKVQAYRKAAHAVLQLDEPLSGVLEKGGLSGIPGIGKTIAARIESWVRGHDFSDLEELRARIPSGLDELLKVPGLGMKRIRILHEQRSIGSVEDLMDAVKEGKVSGLRAFPAKFVSSLPRALERVMSYRGKFTIDLALAYAEEIRSVLAASGIQVHLAGQCRRISEIVEKIEFLVEGGEGEMDKIMGLLKEPRVEIKGGAYEMPPKAVRPALSFIFVSPDALAARLLIATGSAGHLDELKNIAAETGVEIDERGVYRKGEMIAARDEEEIYRLLGLQYLPPEVREGRDVEMALARSHTVPELIRREDVRGTIHNHTVFSDGTSTLEEMVLGARERGYQWIGISDHSRSAYYAGGMSQDDIAEQHREIDELKARYRDIEILKGIESDILADGSLDYPPEILERFDFVVASIHTGMDIDRETMTKRIVTALRNPFTTMLAHPTGRILLSREPYEVDMDAVLEEAFRNNVALELNANPSRLDIDWRLIEPFISAGGIIVLSPDAHTVEGLDDMEFGLKLARKGFLTAGACLNSFGAEGVRLFAKKI